MSPVRRGPVMPSRRALLDFFKCHSATRCRSAAERQRRARGRVDFAAVMHFHDLDIPIGAEPARYLLDDVQQHINPEAHIGRPDDRNRARRVPHASRPARATAR